MVYVLLGQDSFAQVPVVTNIRWSVSEQSVFGLLPDALSICSYRQNRPKKGNVFDHPNSGTEALENPK